MTPKKPYEILLEARRCLDFYFKPLLLSYLKTLHQLIGLSHSFFVNKIQLKINLPLSYEKYPNLQGPVA